MPPSTLAQCALYTASFISAISVAGHTQMGFDVVFPSLSNKLALHDHGAVSAKIGWLEGNMVYGIMGKLKRRFILGSAPLSALNLILKKIRRTQGILLKQFVRPAILCAKWAKAGLVDNHEKAVLTFTALYQIGCGIEFARSGIYEPLVPLVGVPLLAGFSQLV